MNDQDFIRNDLRITCADAVELGTDFLESALNRADRAAFATHLSLCEGCQVFLDQIKATITLVGHAHRFDAHSPPSNYDALLAQLELQVFGPNL